MRDRSLLALLQRGAPKAQLDEFCSQSPEIITSKLKAIAPFCLSDEAWETFLKYAGIVQIIITDKVLQAQLEQAYFRDILQNGKLETLTVKTAIFLSVGYLLPHKFASGTSPMDYIAKFHVNLLLELKPERIHAIVMYLLDNIPWGRYKFKNDFKNPHKMPDYIKCFIDSGLFGKLSYEQSQELQREITNLCDEKFVCITDSSPDGSKSEHTTPSYYGLILRGNNISTYCDPLEDMLLAYPAGEYPEKQLFTLMHPDDVIAAMQDERWHTVPEHFNIILGKRHPEVALAMLTDKSLRPYLTPAAFRIFCALRVEFALEFLKLDEPLPRLAHADSIYTFAKLKPREAWKIAKDSTTEKSERILALAVLHNQYQQAKSTDGLFRVATKLLELDCSTAFARQLIQSAAENKHPQAIAIIADGYYERWDDEKALEYYQLAYTEAKLYAKNVLQPSAQADQRFAELIVIKAQQELQALRPSDTDAIPLAGETPAQEEPEVISSLIDLLQSVPANSTYSLQAKALLTYLIMTYAEVTNETRETINTCLTQCQQEDLSKWQKLYPNDQLVTDVIAVVEAARSETFETMNQQADDVKPDASLQSSVSSSQVSGDLKKQPLDFAAVVSQTFLSPPLVSSSNNNAQANSDPKLDVAEPANDEAGVLKLKGAPGGV